MLQGRESRHSHPKLPHHYGQDDLILHEPSMTPQQQQQQRQLSWICPGKGILPLSMLWQWTIPRFQIPMTPDNKPMYFLIYGVVIPVVPLTPCPHSRTIQMLNSLLSSWLVQGACPKQLEISRKGQLPLHQAQNWNNGKWATLILTIIRKNLL